MENENKFIEKIQQLEEELRQAEEKIQQLEEKLRQPEAILAILMTNLKGNLPSLEDIAKTVGLTESTLKRKFKSVYGKSIYEYYLVEKMKYGKELLIKENLSVAEVAGILGYKKISNFIAIFKNHFGYTPGNLKKNKSPNVVVQSGT